MPIIVLNCQHCDEQQFQTFMCTLPDYPVVKLDLFIRALLLDHNLTLEKIRVRLAYILVIHTCALPTKWGRVKLMAPSGDCPLQMKEHLKLAALVAYARSPSKTMLIPSPVARPLTAIMIGLGNVTISFTSSL